MPPPPSVSFAAVKAILDRLVAGREDMLAPLHGPKLSWADKKALRDAVVVAFDTGESFRLISPELVGVRKATETNLYKVLTTGVGINPKQMPYGGPYATPAELKVICDWIDASMPD
jgi:hypothetical protein